MNLVTKESLEKMLLGGCQVPGCGCSAPVLFFHGKCHPTSPVEVGYEKGSGKLEIGCAVCHRHIATVLVQSEEWALPA